MSEKKAADQKAVRSNAEGETPKAAAPKRRRKKRKYRTYRNLFALINAAACLLMLFVTGFVLLVGKRASGFIQSENRNLAEFPSFSLKTYFSGEYTDGIVNYYTDTIPTREKLRAAANKFTEKFGIHSNDVAVYGSGGTAEKESLDESEKAMTNNVTVYIATKAPETTETTALTDENAAVNTEPEMTEAPLETKVRTEVPAEGEIVNSSIIVSGKGTPEVRAMPMFGGLFENGRYYADVLNQYKQMVGNTVNVYNMSVPLSSAYYMPKNLESQFSDQHDCIQNIGLALNGVINVDIYPALYDHADEYIYFRTDHHWQPLGAYYAAKEFAKLASVPFVDLKDYEHCEKTNFCGTMYGYTNYLEDLQTYPDTFYYYKPKNQYTIRYFDETFANPEDGELFYDWATGVNTYSTILGGDLNIAEIKTDVHNGRTLVVIKNSYGNALVPFFVGSFEKVYVVDFRYVQIGMQDFFRRVGATDVLFGMAISSCYTPEHIAAIQEIMY